MSQSLAVSWITSAPALAGFAVFAVTILPALRRPSRRRDRAAWAGVTCCVVIYAAGLVIACALGSWPQAVCYAVVLVVICGTWWRRRRRRKARTEYGYKAKATIADLVRAMRQSLKPRPVLAPGGAR